MSDTPPKTVSQAAAYSGYHPKTVLRALQKGELRGYQRGVNCTWRVFNEDLDAWIRGEQPQRSQRPRRRTA